MVRDGAAIMHNEFEKRRNDTKISSAARASIDQQNRAHTTTSADTYTRQGFDGE